MVGISFVVVDFQCLDFFLFSHKPMRHTILKWEFIVAYHNFITFFFFLHLFLISMFQFHSENATFWFLERKMAWKNSFAAVNFSYFTYTYYVTHVCIMATMRPAACWQRKNEFNWTNYRLSFHNMIIGAQWLHF